MKGDIKAESSHAGGIENEVVAQVELFQERKVLQSKHILPCHCGRRIRWGRRSIKINRELRFPSLFYRNGSRFHDFYLFVITLSYRIKKLAAVDYWYTVVMSESIGNAFVNEHLDTVVAKINRADRVAPADSAYPGYAVVAHV